MPQNRTIRHDRDLPPERAERGGSAIPIICRCAQRAAERRRDTPIERRIFKLHAVVEDFVGGQNGVNAGIGNDHRACRGIVRTRAAKMPAHPAHVRSLAPRRFLYKQAMEPPKTIDPAGVIQPLFAARQDCIFAYFNIFYLCPNQAAALGRAEAASYQRAKFTNSGGRASLAGFMKSAATNAVMSAMV